LAEWLRRLKYTFALVIRRRSFLLRFLAVAVISVHSKNLFTAVWKEIVLASEFNVKTPGLSSSQAF